MSASLPRYHFLFDDSPPPASCLLHSTQLYGQGAASRPFSVSPRRHIIAFIHNGLEQPGILFLSSLDNNDDIFAAAALPYLFFVGAAESAVARRSMKGRPRSSCSPSCPCGGAFTSECHRLTESLSPGLFPSIFPYTMATYLS